MNESEPLSPADVLEKAADLIYVYGRATGAGKTRTGEYCVQGAVCEVRGKGTQDALLAFGDPALMALGRYLAQHTEALNGLDQIGSFAEFMRRGHFPAWIWNDQMKGAEGDALVIDTLRHCAKDLRRNEVTA